MSIERIVVNGRELTSFDLPPEPSDTCHVWVDGIGDIVVEKGEPPKEKDVPAMYMRKLVPELCEQNVALIRENAKLREELADVSKCETCEAMLDCDECLRADDSQKERKRIAFENAELRELCIGFASMLTHAGLDGLSVEATISGVTKTYDASELCDKVAEIWDKEGL